MQNIHDSPFSNFVWFLGVVEDIDDPKKAHRVRVRCIGFHSEDLASTPSDTLPWAPVLQSCALMMSAPGLLRSDWVVGFFLDGIDAQQPVILGKLEGNPEDRGKAGMGFSDPLGVYPKKLGVFQNSPLARADDITGSAIEWKNGSLAPGEPPSPYAAKYPYNRVSESDAGHIIELDDTEGAERVHIFHKAGSFFEIHPDGTLVVRSVKDAYEAVLADKTLYVSGELKIQAAGDINIRSSGNLRFEAGGDIELAAGGAFNVGAGGSGSVVASGVLELNGATVKQGTGSNKAGSPVAVKKHTTPPYR